MGFSDSLFTGFSETINGKVWNFTYLDMTDIFEISKDIRIRECNKIDVDLASLSELQRYKMKSNVEISFDYTITYILNTIHGNLLAIHYGAIKNHPELKEKDNIEIFRFSPFIVEDLARRIVNVPLSDNSDNVEIKEELSKENVNSELEPPDNKKKL